MGFRARKSIRIAKGVNLNVSKSGLGLSVGTKGARYSVHSSGRRTTSVGIPGTGVGYTSTKGGGRRPARSSAQAGRGSGVRPWPPPQSAPTGIAGTVAARRPGLFASKGEKAFHKAVTSDSIDAIRQVAETFPEYRLVADTLAGLKLAALDNPIAAKPLLERVFRSGQEPSAQPFMREYLPAMGLVVGVAPGVTAELALSRDAIGLLLAEVDQTSGDLDGAIAIVEQVQPSAHAAVSLAELYIEAGRPQDVIDLTEGVSNEDDATALLTVFRGVAFRELDHLEAAKVAFKEALKSKKREPVIRHRALFERARTYKAEGKRSQARKDLERIMAEDSDYEGLQQALAELTA